MKYTVVFSLALATFAIASPLPNADPEADPEAEALASAVELGVDLAVLGHWQTADEPVDLVSRQVGPAAVAAQGPAASVSAPTPPSAAANATPTGTSLSLPLLTSITH